MSTALYYYFSPMDSILSHLRGSPPTHALEVTQIIRAHSLRAPFTTTFSLSLSV